MKNNTLILSAAWICGASDQPPNARAGSIGACGWMRGLPNRNASPVPSMIRAMPTATSLTRRSWHAKAWQRPSSAPAAPASATPAQGLWVA